MHHKLKLRVRRCSPRLFILAALSSADRLTPVLYRPKRLFATSSPCSPGKSLAQRGCQVYRRGPPSSQAEISRICGELPCQIACPAFPFPFSSRVWYSKVSKQSRRSQGRHGAARWPGPACRALPAAPFPPHLVGPSSPALLRRIYGFCPQLCPGARGRGWGNGNKCSRGEGVE